MNSTFFLRLLNAIAAIIMIAIFFPLFKAKEPTDIDEAIKSRINVVAEISGKSSQSIFRTVLYFFQSFVMYIALVMGSHVAFQLNLASASLMILIGLTVIKLWKFRRSKFSTENDQPCPH